MVHHPQIWRMQCSGMRVLLSMNAIHLSRETSNTLWYMFQAESESKTCLAGWKIWKRQMHSSFKRSRDIKQSLDSTELQTSLRNIQVSSSSFKTLTSYIPGWGMKIFIQAPKVYYGNSNRRRIHLQWAEGNFWNTSNNNKSWSTVLSKNVMEFLRWFIESLLTMMWWPIVDF